MAPVSRRRPEPSTSMLDTIANAVAEADGRALADDPARYRRMALAALYLNVNSMFKPGGVVWTVNPDT